jgi:hypothetical protein
MFVGVLSHCVFPLKIFGSNSGEEIPEVAILGSCVWISLLGCVVVVAVLVPWCFVSLFL